MFGRSIQVKYRTASVRCCYLGRGLLGREGSPWLCLGLQGGILQLHLQALLPICFYGASPDKHYPGNTCVLIVSMSIIAFCCCFQYLCCCWQYRPLLGMVWCRVAENFLAECSFFSTSVMLLGTTWRPLQIPLFQFFTCTSDRIGFQGYKAAFLCSIFCLLHSGPFWFL